MSIFNRTRFGAAHVTIGVGPTATSLTPPRPAACAEALDTCAKLGVDLDRQHVETLSDALFGSRTPKAGKPAKAGSRQGTSPTASPRRSTCPSRSWSGTAVSRMRIGRCARCSRSWRTGLPK